MLTKYLKGTLKRCIIISSQNNFNSTLLMCHIDQIVLINPNNATNNIVLYLVTFPNIQQLLPPPDEHSICNEYLNPKPYHFYVSL